MSWVPLRRFMAQLATCLAPFRFGAQRRAAEDMREERFLLMVQTLATAQLQATRELTAAQTESFASAVKAVQTTAEATAKQAEGFSQWMALISKQYGDPTVVHSTPAHEAQVEMTALASRLEEGMPLTADVQAQLAHLLDFQ